MFGEQGISLFLSFSLSPNLSLSLCVCVFCALLCVRTVRYDVRVLTLQKGQSDVDVSNWGVDWSGSHEELVVDCFTTSPFFKRLETQ